ncbi:MAG: CPBP family intramembrane glutamic endopeptidase [Labilithrix sp.]
MSQDSTPPDPPQDRPLTFFTAGIWTLIALLLSTVIITMFERDRATIDGVTRTGGLALAYSIVLFGVLRLHEPQASIRHVLGLRMPSVLAILLSVAIGASLELPSDWIDNVLAPRFPTPPEEEEAVNAFLAVTSVGKGVSLFVTLGLIQPILFELFFRGVIFTPLRRTYRAETVILGVAAFDTFGNLASPRAALALLASTLVFSWLRGVTGSVIPAIAAHVGFSVVGVLPICMRLPEVHPTKTLLIASGVTALASLIGLSLVSRTARAIDARQRDAGEVPL